MLAFCIGFALLWLSVTLRGKSYTITGLSGIILTIFISYGLGSLVLMLVRAGKCG